MNMCRLNEIQCINLGESEVICEDFTPEHFDYLSQAWSRISTDDQKVINNYWNNNKHIMPGPCLFMLEGRVDGQAYGATDFNGFIIRFDASIIQSHVKNVTNDIEGILELFAHEFAHVYCIGSVNDYSEKAAWARERLWGFIPLEQPSRSV